MAPTHPPSTPPLIPTHLTSTVSPMTSSPPPPAPAAPSAPPSITTAGTPIPPRTSGLGRINTSHRGSKRKRDRSHSPALANVSASDNAMSSSPPSSPRILRTHMAHLRLRSNPSEPLPGGVSSAPSWSSPQHTRSTPPPSWAESPLPSPKRVRRPSCSSAISNASDDESDDEPIQSTRMNFPVPAHLRSHGPSPLQNSFSAMFTMATSPPKTRSVTKAAARAGLQPSLMVAPDVASPAPLAADILPVPTPSAQPHIAANFAPAPEVIAPIEEKPILKAHARLLNVAAPMEKQGTEVEKLHVLGYGRALRSRTALRSSGLAKQRDDAPVENLEKAGEKALREVAKAKARMQVDE